MSQSTPAPPRRSSIRERCVHPARRRSPRYVRLRQVLARRRHPRPIGGRHRRLPRPHGALQRAHQVPHLLHARHHRDARGLSRFLARRRHRARWRVLGLPRLRRASRRDPAPAPGVPRSAAHRRSRSWATAGRCTRPTPTSSARRPRPRRRGRRADPQSDRSLHPDGDPLPRPGRRPGVRPAKRRRAARDGREGRRHQGRRP